MRCSQAEELMSLSLDGEATPEQFRMLESHTGSCEGCLQRWRSVRSISTLFGTAPMARPTNSLVSSVMQRIERMEATRTPRRRSPDPIAIMVLAALCAVVAGNLLLSAAVFVVGEIGIPSHYLVDLVGAAWKIIPILRLIGDIGWEIAQRLVGVAQPSLFALTLSATVILAVLWAHIVKNYRGEKVRY